jgi:polyferredoxin
MNQFLDSWKIFDRILAPFEQSYVELAAFLSLCALATAALLARRNRQVWRFGIQLLSLVVFFFVASSCLGVFGLIRNGFYGLKLLSQQDDLNAFFWLSMTVVALAASFAGGSIFCGWICPTGTLQEWAGWLGRRLGGQRTRPSLPSLTVGPLRSEAVLRFRWAALVSWVVLVGAYLVVAYRVFSARRPLLEDSATLWAGALSVLVALTLIAPGRAGALKRFRGISLLIILGFSAAGLAVFSPVHFIFMDVSDWGSLLSAVVIVGAGVFVARAWCRFLCPFGLLSGWVARYAAFRIEKKGHCAGCGVCSRECEVDAIDKGEIEVTACIACMKCVDYCPHGALALEARPFGERADDGSESVRS